MLGLKYKTKNSWAKGKKKKLVWWYMLTVPATGEATQEDHLSPEVWGQSSKIMISCILKKINKLSAVAHTYNPSNQGG